jgi:hypothetical protein
MYDSATKYAFYLSTNPKVAQQASILLYELETYVNGAIIETDRLIRTRKVIDNRMKMYMDKIEQRPTNKKDTNLLKLHLDYHFYFICIGQISKLLKGLVEILDDQDLKNILVEFDSKFPKEIRNDLEHINERARGRKFNKDIGHISDFGNFAGDSFSFDGKMYHINKESLGYIKAMYKAVLNTLYRNHASNNPDFMRMEQMENQSKKIQRYIKKLRFTNPN